MSAKNKKPEKILVWHKVQSQGFQPSAREGHSTVTCGSKMIVWGGIETGRRVNTTQILDVSTGIWSAKAAGNSLMEKDAEVKHDATTEDDAKAHLGVGDAETIDSDADEDPDAMENDEDDIPSPRNQHAACLVKFNKKENSGPDGETKHWDTLWDIDINGRDQYLEGVDASSHRSSRSNYLMLVHGGEGVYYDNFNVSIPVRSYPPAYFFLLYYDCANITHTLSYHHTLSYYHILSIYSLFTRYTSHGI